MKTQFDIRSEILLKAAYDIIKQCNDAPYVTSPFEVTSFYDEAYCDGYCLMDDIKNHLEIEE